MKSCIVDFTADRIFVVCIKNGGGVVDDRDGMIDVETIHSFDSSETVVVVARFQVVTFLLL